MNKSKLIVVALLIAFVLGPALNLGAQSGNLLQNPGMENPYIGQGASDQTAPAGWGLWTLGVPVISYPHTDQSEIHGGAAAWNIRKGSTTFTAGGYQAVPGIRAGSTVRAGVYGRLFTCNDATYSCKGNDGKFHSNTGSGAIIKVGIDPSGGTNPSSSQIVWSGPIAPFDSWGFATVDAIACNTTVTIFVYATQSTAMLINNAYFDDASLAVIVEGTGTTPTCGPAPVGSPAPPTAVYAPFVTKQDGLQPDGSIIHVVVSGDTLAGIAVAYGVTLDQIRELNGFKSGDGRFLQIGQKIIVRGPTPGAGSATEPATPAGVPTLTTPTSEEPTAVAMVPTVTPELSSSGASALSIGMTEVIEGLLRIWLSMVAAG